MIVDLVPFGYDVDLLEIRFFETYEQVDVFVIYESTITQSGWQKPLFFEEQKDRRFSRFQDKIIHLTANATELEAFANQVSGRNKSQWDSWALEKAMRTELIRRFKHSLSQLQPSHRLYPLHTALGEAQGIEVYGIQVLSLLALYSMHSYLQSMDTTHNTIYVFFGCRTMRTRS